MPGLNLNAIALPPNAREDLAWSDTIIVAGVAGTATFTFKVPGEYLFYPTYVLATAVTDANVGARLLLYQVNNSDGVTVLQNPASVTQPASIGYVYQIVLGLATPYAPTVAFPTFPLPSYLLLSNYTLSISLAGNGPADSLAVRVSGIKIPTGPPVGIGPPSLGAPVLAGAS